MLMCCLSCAKADSCEQADRVEDYCDHHEERPMTNADRIRQMTDEELADRIMCYIRCEVCEIEFHIECNPLMTCRGVWLDWLKSPVEDKHG